MNLCGGEQGNMEYRELDDIAYGDICKLLWMCCEWEELSREWKDSIMDLEFQSFCYIEFVIQKMIIMDKQTLELCEVK